MAWHLHAVEQFPRGAPPVPRRLRLERAPQLRPHVGLRGNQPSTRVVTELRRHDSTPSTRVGPEPHDVHTARNDAPRHDHEALAPPRLQLRIREDGVDDARPEGRRIRIQRPRQLAQMPAHSGSLPGGSAGRDDGASSFRIEPKVLGKRDAGPGLQAFVTKESKGRRISIDVARRKTQISAVEDRQKTLRLT